MKDYLTGEDARRNSIQLCHQIENYWRQRGKRVHAWVEVEEVTDYNGRTQRTCFVRSDIVFEPFE